MDSASSCSDGWKLIDRHRIHARNMELRLSRAVMYSKLQQEHLRHWMVQPNLEAFKSVGGQIGRTMLFSWLFEECSSRNLSPSTAFLAVNYMDRMLSKGCHSPKLAQAIASTCIRLAAKMEQVGGDNMHVPFFTGHPPPLHSELYVLNALKWQMNVPTVHSFLTMFAELFWIPPISRGRAVEYAKHISLYVESQQFYPSSLAVVCILLLEQDSLLPLPCKALALNLVRDKTVNANEVSHGFKTFRHVCYSFECEHHDDDHYQRSGTDGSSTTAYPDSSSTQSSLPTQLGLEA